MPEEDDGNHSPKRLPPAWSGNLEVSIPDEIFEAGALCVARIIIRNPFDVPVEIVTVEPPQSSRLRHWRPAAASGIPIDPTRNGTTSKSESDQTPESTFWSKLQARLPVLDQITFGLGSLATFKVTYPEPTRGGNSFVINADGKARVTVRRDLDRKSVV